MNLKVLTISCIMPLISFGQESIRSTTFFKDGKLKAVYHQGNFNGCGMPVGTDTFFYPSGKLKSTINYDNRNGIHGGCHNTLTIKTTKIYYSNGQLKGKFQTKSSYEGEPCNCGLWLWYNAKGLLVKTAHFRDCSDSAICD